MDAADTRRDAVKLEVAFEAIRSWPAGGSGLCESLVGVVIRMGVVVTVSERCPGCGLKACNVLWVGHTDDGSVARGVDFGEDVNATLCGCRMVGSGVWKMEGG